MEFDDKIRRYILSFTKKEDLIFKGFCVQEKTTEHYLCFYSTTDNGVLYVNRQKINYVIVQDIKD